MRLVDVNTRRLSGLNYELVCRFKLAVDRLRVVSGSLCMLWTDQHSEKRELIGFGVDGPQ